MRASYHSVSSARRFSSWLAVALGLVAYVGLIYGLTLLPLQLEVPLPHWGVALVPPVVYALLVLLFVRRPSIVRWLVGTAVLSVLHVLLALAREPLTALIDPALAGHPVAWMLPPPLPELVGVMLLLVPLRDVLRARPRPARERVPGAPRAASSARGRAVVTPRPQPMAPAEGPSALSDTLPTPRREPLVEPVIPEASAAAVPSPPPGLIDELPRRRPVPRAERRRESTATGPARRSDVVLRIALDRIMGQLPPGTFLAPEDEVAASLGDPGYLRIPGQLVVTQLREGVAHVAWSDIVDQFPPHLIGLGSAEIGEHLGDGLRLPLDEVIGQLGHELFVTDMPEVEIAGLERIPVPFHPSDESASARSAPPERAPETIPSPPMERPPAPTVPVTPTPLPVETPASAVEVAPGAPPAPVGIRLPAASPPVEEAPRAVSDPIRAPEPEAEPEAGPVVQVDGPTVRISFGRIAPEIPADAFRVPLEQVAEQMWQPGSLLVPLPLVLPQLAEGLIQVSWDAVGPQFPRAQMAVSDAEMLERLPSGIRLPLDEVIRQIPPDLFMSSGPAADVRGLESFPAPFQPLVSDPSPEPPPAPTEVPAPVAETAPPSQPASVPLAEAPPLVSPDAPVGAAADLVDVAEPEPAVAAEVSAIVESDSEPGDGLGAELEPAPPLQAGWQEPSLAPPEAIAPVEPASREPLAMTPEPMVVPESVVPESTLAASEFTVGPEQGRGRSLPAAPSPIPAPVSVPSAVVEPAPGTVEPAWRDIETASAPIAVPAVVGPAQAAEARRIVALLAPIAAFDVSVQTVDGVTVFALAAPTVAQETAIGVAGLALPLLTERRAPWPLDQITLRGPGTALVLTPLGGSSAAVLATAATRGGALALLEILSRRAAGDHESRVGPGAAHVLPDGGHGLVPVAAPLQSARLAASLTAFGVVTPSLLRDAEGEGVLHFFLPAGEDVLAVGAFAQDLQAVMRKAAGSGAVFRTAVLRSGNTLLVIQPEEVGHDRSIVVVAGGPVTRPGLAYRQVERVTAILAQA